jgi:hypothetical protein
MKFIGFCTGVFGMTALIGTFVYVWLPEGESELIGNVGQTVFLLYGLAALGANALLRGPE